MAHEDFPAIKSVTPYSHGWSNFDCTIKSMIPRAQCGRVACRSGLRLALLMLALASPGAVAPTPVETPRTIRVVMDNAYAPYSFQSDDGKLQGILIDQWQAWQRKTGIKVEVHAMDWGEALRRTRAGEFDVIDSGTTSISLRPIPRSKRRSSFAMTFPVSPTLRR